MPDYDLAVKKPFTNFKKLVIGILLSILPIIRLFAYGYILECSGLGRNKTNKLPEWKNFGDLFLKGFLATIIAIVYSIPALLVLLIFGATALFALIKGIMTPELIQAISAGSSAELIQPIIEQNIPGLMPLILSLLPVLIIAGLLGILAGYVVPMAILNYIKNNKFDSAFKKLVFKKAFTGKYLLTWILVLLISIIAGSIFSYVPIIGGAMSFFIMGVFGYTLFGQVYLELESNVIEAKVKKKKKK